MEVSLEQVQVVETMQRLLAAGAAQMSIMVQGSPDSKPIPDWQCWNGPWSDVRVPADFAADGSVVATRWGDAGGWFPELADLLEDLSCAYRAAVSAAVCRLRGSTVLGAEPDGWILLLPVSQPVEASPTGGEPVLVEPGSIVVSRSWSEVRPVTDDATVVEIRVRAMTAKDLRRGVIEVAKYWPRFRAEIPYDPAQPTEMYGFEEPVDYLSVIAEELQVLLSSETAAMASAWWAASLRPQRRAQQPYASTDRPSAVRGRFVGEPGHVGDTDLGAVIAAGSVLLDLPSAVVDELPALVGNHWIDPAALSTDMREIWVPALAGVGLVELRV